MHACSASAIDGISVFARRVERAFELGDDARAIPAADVLVYRCEDVSIGEIRAHTALARREAPHALRHGTVSGSHLRRSGRALFIFGWPRAVAREPFVPPVRIDTL